MKSTFRIVEELSSEQNTTMKSRKEEGYLMLERGQNKGLTCALLVPEAMAKP
jgi:hypothetical protein